MLTHEQYTYLLNLLKRKQYKCNYVIKNEFTIYQTKPEVVQRARKSLELIEGIIRELGMLQTA